MHNNFVSTSYLDGLQCLCSLCQSTSYFIRQRQNMTLSQCFFEMSPKFCRAILVVSRIGHDIFPGNIFMCCNYGGIDRKRRNNQASLRAE